MVYISLSFVYLEVSPVGWCWEALEPHRKGQVVIGPALRINLYSSHRRRQFSWEWAVGNRENLFPLWLPMVSWEPVSMCSSYRKPPAVRASANPEAAATVFLVLWSCKLTVNSFKKKMLLSFRLCSGNRKITNMMKSVFFFYIAQTTSAFFFILKKNY